MKLRRFASSTQELYIFAVEGLAKYYNRSPDRILKRDPLLFLAIEGGKYEKDKDSCVHIYSNVCFGGMCSGSDSKKPGCNLGPGK